MINIKNPNGYGSVVKLSGNRRKPFAVRKTIGWNEKGHPIYLPIGYTETREEGIILLAQYNNDPWDVDRVKITFTELFELWKEKRMPKLGDANQYSLCAAYKHCKKIYNMRYREVKSFHMQDVVDSCGKGYSTQGAIKNLFGHLDRFAMELDVVAKCYSDLVTVDPTPETTRSCFSDEEITRLWELYEQGEGRRRNLVDIPAGWVDSVLVFIYSGFRISELLGIKTSDVDLKVGTFTGGVKSAAGKNRIVPIHSLIFKMVERRINEGNDYLFSYNGKHCSRAQYYILWNQIMDKLSIEKTPHECRHTFESLLDSAGANRKCIDLMMGHKSKDTGQRVYTHKTIQELKTAIELIKRKSTT